LYFQENHSAIRGAKQFVIHLSVFPENTMVGYREVMGLNVAMLEIDVHLTKDQHFVVIHDETIDRTSDGKGRIAPLPLDNRPLYFQENLSAIHDEKQFVIHLSVYSESPCQEVWTLKSC
jgi:glycerophosphoryl diester phosphodiesterase